MNAMKLSDAPICCSFFFFFLLALLLSFKASAAAFDFPPLPSIPNPWLPFMNLSGCQRGDHNPGLPDLKDYLHHFGYLPHSPNFTDAFDDALEAAIRTYQQNFGLNSTGVLDTSTVQQLVMPRCGVADVINGTSTMASGRATHGRALYAFFPGNPTWPSYKRHLTYAITATSAVSIETSVLRTVFSAAFAKWAAATTLTFSEVGSDSGPDITIGFYKGAHGDGEPFDGVLGTLAHAFSPTDGRFHLDAAEDWVAEGDVTEASSNTAVDLESVAVHEIGHLLGLGHTSVAEAIMYPTLRTRTRKVELAEDDVEGIQLLYGSNPNFTGVSPTTEREVNSGAVWLTGGGLGRVAAAVVVVGLLVI